MSVYENNRGKWIIDIDDFFHSDGRKEPRIRKTASIQRERDAKKQEMGIRTSLAAGTYGKFATKTSDALTLTAFSEVFLALCRGEKRKATGIRNHVSLLNKHLGPLFGERKVDSFCSEDQQTLLTQFAEHKSHSRYNNAVATMNGIIELFHLRSKRPGEPFRFKAFRVDGTTKPFYEFSQYAALLVAAEQLGIVYELVCLLGGDAGLRRGEILALRPQHCRMDQRMLIIESAETLIGKERHLGTTKGRDIRPIDMTKRLHGALSRYFAKHKGNSIIMVDESGNQFTADTFRTMMATIQSAAGLRANGGVHILRHTFCSHLAIRGVPIKTIQELAGHRQIETTLGYMHLARGDKRRAIDMLEEPAPC